MGQKLYGFSPSSITHTNPTSTRDIPAFQISGMSESFGAIPVCLYCYSGNQWVPLESDWLK